MRGSSVLPAFTPRMPPQPSSMSCGLVERLDLEAVPRTQLGRDVRHGGCREVGGRAVGQVARDGCRPAGHHAGGDPARDRVGVGSVEGQHELGQRLLGVLRTQGGEAVAREERALGGDLPGVRRGEVGRRHPDAEPPARARRRPGGGGRGVAQGRPVETAGWSGTDEHEQRLTTARHDEGRPGGGVETGCGERRAVEVGAEVAGQVPVGVNEHGDGIDPGRVERGDRRHLDGRALGRHGAVVGGDQRTGVAGHRVAPRVD